MTFDKDISFSFFLSFLPSFLLSFFLSFSLSLSLSFFLSFSLSLSPFLPFFFLSIYLSIYLTSIFYYHLSIFLNLVIFGTVDLLLLTPLFWPLWARWLLVLLLSCVFVLKLLFKLTILCPTLQCWCPFLFSLPVFSLDNLDHSHGGSYCLYSVSFPYCSSVSISLWGPHTLFQPSPGFCHWVVLQLPQILYV